LRDVVSVKDKMSDPLRTLPIQDNKSAQAADAERDAKIESLLLAGLDHYFASSYAQAIDVWTRALFLDRNHARARAYIERARSALAEEQRESDELLHSGIAAFERGEIEAARQLLNAAVQRGGAHEVALAFLTRIDRINAATPATSTTVAAPMSLPFRSRAVATPPRRSKWIGALVAAVIVLLSTAVVVSWDEMRTWIPALASGAEDGATPARSAPEPLIVPRSAETALERARSLYASGRLYDALRAVDLVRPTDPLRGEADKLKADIQRELLAFQTPPSKVEGRD
jgi:tetratricopeptide (TPR) repeat protein